MKVEQKSSYNQIKSLLEKEGVSRDKPVILYSYWFHSTAKIAVDLKLIISNDVTYSFSRGHAYDVIEEVSAVKFLPMRKFLLDNLDDLYLVSSTKARSMQEEYPEFEIKSAIAEIRNKKIVDSPISKNENYFSIMFWYKAC